jgi:hypothetical protein
MLDECCSYRRCDGRRDAKYWAAGTSSTNYVARTSRWRGLTGRLMRFECVRYGEATKEQDFIVALKPIVIFNLAIRSNNDNNNIDIYVSDLPIQWGDNTKSFSLFARTWSRTVVIASVAKQTRK